MRRSVALLALFASACSLDDRGLLSDPGVGGTSSSGGGGSGSGGAPGGAGGSGAGGSDAGGSDTGGSAGQAGGGLGGSSGSAGSGGASSCGAGQQCVPTAPTGWSYGFLAKSAFSAGATSGPSCHDGSAPQRFYIDPIGAAQCAPCSCGPLQNGTCSVPLLCAKNKTCSGVSDWSQGDGSCQPQLGSPDLSCKLGTPVFGGNPSCAPAGGQLVASDPWKLAADLCLSQGSPGCAAGFACVPVATGAYAGSACVYMPGDQTCPAEYPTKSLAFKKALDTRACSACTCGTPTMACVGTEYKFYDDAVCAGGSQPVNSPACVDLSGHINDFWLGWSYQRSGTGTVTGTCPASGGKASGALVGDPASSLTICCRPVP